MNWMHYELKIQSQKSPHANMFSWRWYVSCWRQIDTLTIMITTQKKYLLVKNCSTDQRKSLFANSKWWLHLLCANFHWLWMGDLKHNISHSVDLIYRITKRKIKGYHRNTAGSYNIKNRAKIMEASNAVLSFFFLNKKC